MDKTHLTKLLNEINVYYNEQNCVVISFIKTNLLRLKNISNIRLQLLFENNKKENMEFCINNKIDASMNFALLDIFTIKKLHKNKLKVGAWTVNSFFIASNLANLGVDYITTDFKLK